MHPMKEQKSNEFSLLATKKFSGDLVDSSDSLGRTTKTKTFSKSNIRMSQQAINISSNLLPVFEFRENIFDSQ